MSSLKPSPETQLESIKFNRQISLKFSPESQHEFLSGNYAPVIEEQSGIACGEVQGEIPKILYGGEYVRATPNTHLEKEIKENGWNFHWFDGDGVLSGVYIDENGSPFFVHRFVQTEKLQNNLKPASVSAMGRGTWEFVKAMWGTIMGAVWYKISNQSTANTALVYHDSRLLALNEGGLPYHVSAPALETVGTFNFDGRYKSEIHTAHPKVDPVTKELITFGCEFKKSEVYYAVISENGEEFRDARIPIRAAQMMHDFAITEHYSIVMDQGFQLDFTKFGGDVPILNFNLDIPMKFAVIPRYFSGKQEDIKWFTAKRGYIYHTGNAWEDGKEIVLYACRSELLDISFLDRTPDCQPRLYRYFFNLETGETREEAVSDDSLRMEFPLVSHLKLGRRSRYIYSARLTQGTRMPNVDGLLKFDLETGETKILDFGPQIYVGEASFVPSESPDAAEDDGFLLTFIHNEQTNQSSFVVINAQTMDSNPIAKVDLPSRVPYGFHGYWINKEEIKKQRVPSVETEIFKGFSSEH